MLSIVEAFPRFSGESSIRSLTSSSLMQHRLQVRHPKQTVSFNTPMVGKKTPLLIVQ
jgi:hypothetical protein